MNIMKWCKVSNMASKRLFRIFKAKEELIGQKLYPPFHLCFAACIGLMSGIRENQTILATLSYFYFLMVQFIKKYINIDTFTTHIN